MKSTKIVNIGGVKIGGECPVAVQSMTNTRTNDVLATSNQIRVLEAAGCDIVRVAVLDKSDACAIAEIKKKIRIPLVADIHFDSALAVAAIEHGADKVRINPGNIGDDKKSKAVLDCARANGVPIRIGVNGGSVEESFLRIYGDRAKALTESLLARVRFFERQGFENLVLSVKSSDTLETIRANRFLSGVCDYPLHIGVTEAGVGEVGLIKNSIGIGALLADGIGDTIRVSLTEAPEEEVRAGNRILMSLGLRKGLEFVSCPSCGRCRGNLIQTAKDIYEFAKQTTNPVKIAVMGCAVNGPGEAKEADIGLALGTDKAVFFKAGEIYRFVDMSVAVEEFKKELQKML